MGVKIYQNNFSSNDLYQALIGITPSGSLFNLPFTVQSVVHYMTRFSNLNVLTLQLFEQLDPPHHPFFNLELVNYPNCPNFRYYQFHSSKLKEFSVHFFKKVGFHVHSSYSVIRQSLEVTLTLLNTTHLLNQDL